MLQLAPEVLGVEGDRAIHVRGLIANAVHAKPRRRLWCVDRHGTSALGSIAVIEMHSRKPIIKMIARLNRSLNCR
jgi:hypothetical protein